RGELIYTSLSERLPEDQRQFGETYDLNLIDGRVYWGTLNFIFQWDGQSLTAFPKRDRIFRMTLAHQGRLLALIGRDFHDLTEFPADDEPLDAVPGLTQPEGVRVTFAQSWPDGRLMMGTLENGLYWLSEGAEPEVASAIPELTEAWPFFALALGDRSIALGTRYQGVMHLSSEGELLDHLTERNGLDSNVVSAMTMDREGGLWLALEGSIARVDWFNGLRFYDSDLGVRQAEGVIEHQGEILVAGSHGVGVLRADGTDGSALQSLEAPMLEAFGLLDDGDGVLVSGSEGVHRMVFDLAAGQTVSSERLIEDTYGYKLHRSRLRDVIYAELESGLGVLVRGSDGWEAVQRIEGIDRRAGPVAETDDGTVWVGTTGGLFYRLRWTAEDDLVLDATLDEDDAVPDGFAWPFDLGDRVVLGTSDGGFRPVPDGEAIELDPGFGNADFDASRSVYKLFAVNDDTVVGGVGDGGALWLGERSVSGDLSWPRRLRPELPPGQNWFFKILRGQLWFGRHPGLYRIDLSQLAAASPPEGQVQVQRVGFPDEDRWLHGGPNAAAVLEIDREQPTLRFEYALGSYQRTDQTEYRSRLGGLESNWSRWSDEIRRDYAQLPAGEYDFQIQARDVQGRVIDSVPIALRVLPRWYESPLAWLVYGLIGLLLLGLSAQWGQARRAKRMQAQQRELEQQVAERTAEARASAREVQRLSDARAEFFANVSHELRTPLTLTRAPLEELAREPRLSEEGQRYLSLAQRSTDQMQSLIGQVLDLQKLEVGEMPLRLVRSDLALAVRRVVDRFSVMADAEKIDLQGEGFETESWAVFDPRHVDTMLSNLLSNALKFTPAGGQVSVRLLADGEIDTRTYEIQVQDSGPGVPESDRKDIFERYRQGSVTAPAGGGTGIGLALVRELIELHGGQIQLDSSSGAGACFTLSLPGRLQPMEAGQGTEIPVSEAAISVDARDLLPAPAESPKVLLVDDNAELREFLRLRLGRLFQIVEAENGVQGLAQAREELPDLIVTDGMMPELDGLGMTRALKDDPELDFIPVLMLTARGESDAIVQGLAAGADDYLAKPFDGAELVARINGLIATRRRLKARIESESEAASVGVESPFLRAVEQVVDANLSDSGFSVRDWASLMYMDRTTLFRKLKDETGTAPDEYLREARMQRAAELLRQRAGNVAEVSEAVGFASVSSFSRRFKERFDCTPASLARGGKVSGSR
ncbi:MAG: ATP-binding protein, partial [Pseudomonadota bacterium]